MGQRPKGVVEPLHVAVFGLPVSRPDAHDSRTVTKQYLLDTVLPAFALMFISGLTVAMIVLVVTTVAQGGWLAPGTYVNVDPWSSLYPGPAVLREDDIMYPDAVTRQGSEESDLSLDPQVRDGAGAGYFTAQMPE